MTVPAQAFAKYLLSDCYMPGTVLDPEYRARNRRGKGPHLWEFILEGSGRTGEDRGYMNKQIYYLMSGEHL